MGMDGVELVMSFEEEFGISLPDSAAAEMRTPRQVIDFIIEQRRSMEQLDMQSHVSRVLAEMGHASTAPATSFAELFHGMGRVRQWNEFREKLAPLTAPPAKIHGLGCGVAGIGLIALITCFYFSQWMSAGISALIFGAGFLWSRRSMTIPEQTSTIQNLVERLGRPDP